MDEQCKTALELLVQNGYLEAVKGKYRATKKLNEQRADVMAVLEDGSTFTGSWEDLYLQFIKDCKIPMYGETGDNSTYDLNKYTEEAMKQFQSMMVSGIKYSFLVQVTRTYYSQGTRYKKKIGNYITEGHWRMDYEIFKNQDPTQRLETLKQQVDAAKPFTRDRIG